MTIYEGRQADLKNRVNNHLKKLTGQNLDFYSGMNQADLIELKTVLADIHNVLTFRTTIAAANWICTFFKIDEKSKLNILEIIDRIKPNTKGFDIVIQEPFKLIAEVKCISPVNNGSKFGSAQWNSILDDFYKLKFGKGALLDTTQFFKFLFILDLGDRTDQAITQLIKPSKAISEKPIRANRHEIKEHIAILNDDQILETVKTNIVYLKKIRIDP